MGVKKPVNKLAGTLPKKEPGTDESGAPKKSFMGKRDKLNKNVFRKMSLNPVALLLRFSLIPMFKSFANCFDLWFAQMAKE